VVPVSSSKSLCCAAVLLCLGAAAAAQPALTQPVLQGTWTLKSVSYDGVPQTATGYMMFSGGHYSYVTNRSRRELTPGIGGKTPDALSEEEKRLYVEAFRNMTAAAGPFRIEGDEIVYVFDVVRTPNLVGQTERRKSSFTDGRLVQDFVAGGQRQVYVWERRP
jgi:opacity protein-like surface antigen